MHIPDGFLDTKTFVSLGVVSAGTIGLAIKRATKNNPIPQKILLLLLCKNNAMFKP